MRRTSAKGMPPGSRGSQRGEDSCFPGPHGEFIDWLAVWADVGVDIWFTTYHYKWYDGEKWIDALDYNAVQPRISIGLALLPELY